MYGGCARRRSIVDVSDSEHIECDAAETFDDHRHNERSQVLTPVICVVTRAPGPLLQQSPRLITPVLR